MPKKDALKEISKMPPWAWGLVGGAALAAVFAFRRPAATTVPTEYYLPEAPPAQQLPSAEPVTIEKPVVVEVEKPVIVEKEVPVYVPVAPEDYPAAPVSVHVGEKPRKTVKTTKTESPKDEPLTKREVQLRYEEELVKRLGPEKAKEWLKERPTPGAAIVGGQVYEF